MKMTITFRDGNVVAIGPAFGSDDLAAAEQVQAMWQAGRTDTVELVCDNATVDVDLTQVADIKIEVAGR